MPEDDDLGDFPLKMTLKFSEDEAFIRNLPESSEFTVDDDEMNEL